MHLKDEEKGNGFQCFIYIPEVTNFLKQGFQNSTKSNYSKCKIFKKCFTQRSWTFMAELQTT